MSFWESFKSIVSIPVNIAYAVVKTGLAYCGLTDSKSVFEGIERSYKIDNLEVAKLYYKNGMAHIDINSADPSLRGAALANLTGDKFLDFYKSYISILPSAAQLLAGPFTKEPISYIQSEVARRGISFDTYDKAMIKSYVSELNKIIDQKNSNIFLPSLFGYTHFSESDIEAFLAFGDVYKGVGCSTAFRIDGNKIEFIRNLDWSSLGVLSNNMVHLTYLTEHTEADKPHTVHSLTALPGMFGLTAWNDKGLMIAINEVTKMDTKRENTESGTVTEFRIIEKILNDCSTIDEAIAMFNTTAKPATSHILTMVSVAEGKGAVVDVLPTDVADVIRIRPISGDDQYKYSFTTNHFVNKDGEAVIGSEGFSDSYVRYESYKTSLENHLTAKEVADSAVSFDTVNSVIMTAEIGNVDSMKFLVALDNFYATHAEYIEL